MAAKRRKKDVTVELCEPVSLSKYFNWPRRAPDDDWWKKRAETVRSLPTGRQRSWGIPFRMAKGTKRRSERVIMVSKDEPEVTVKVKCNRDEPVTFISLLHAWFQMPRADTSAPPEEGLVVGEYVLTYDDGSTHVQPVRGRYEVSMAASPGPPWLSVPFTMPTSVDPAKPTDEMTWGLAQYAIHMGHTVPQPPISHYALPNPHPETRIKTLTIRGLVESPLIVAGVTLYRGRNHPLRHLPRRTYRVTLQDEARKVVKAEVDLGTVTRIEHTDGPRDETWLDDPSVATMRRNAPPPEGEDLIEAVGAEDATLTVRLEGKKKPLSFSLGQAFRGGTSTLKKGTLEVLGRERQWMHVRVIDRSTGKPSPARVHLSGPHGNYIAPYGHHSQINPNWFEDYGADVLVAGQSYAYVLGEFQTDLPVGDVYVEIYKGFEYEPVRRRVTVERGQQVLELSIDRWKDLRAEGWVTADTHVHFVSPQTAWLEAQAEGVNVVNLLASQWGRLFTNAGDFSGRVGTVEDDTIVQVGTENRNHMLGHMSMLGTQGMPVHPMCGGGPSESWIGDPDYLTMAEWALENRRKGGVVIRPHFPYCGFTEDPVSIIAGLVDALETGSLREGSFPLQEWYGYLNNGYRVAVCGGTDKMSATCPIGWLRTYAKLPDDKPLSYETWAQAVRAGRTISTTGPLMDLQVDGHAIGDTLEVASSGGTFEVHATAESFWPLSRLELVCNGKVVAAEESSEGARSLKLVHKLPVQGSAWIAARCAGHASVHPYLAAHTSPVYVRSGDERLFDGPALKHMLSLVRGGTEYLTTLATLFDEQSRRRMTRYYAEAEKELRERLRTGR